MASSDVIESIKQKFKDSLKPAQERRIVFWMDESKQFESLFEEVSLDGVKKHRLTGSNFLLTKLLIEKSDLTSDYLIYCPLEFTDKHQNWLTDVMLYSEVYRADFASLLIEDLKLPDKMDFRRIIKQYEKFFKSSTRVAKLVQLNVEFKRPIDLEMGIFTVLSNAKNQDLTEILYQIFESGFDKDKNEVYGQFLKYADVNAFGSILNVTYGIKDFISKPLLHAFASIACTATYHKVNDIIKQADVKDFVNSTFSHTCYDAMNRWVHDQSRDNTMRDLLIEVEDFLRIPQRFKELAIDPLSQIEFFPVVNSVLFTELVQGLLRLRAKPHDVMGIILKRREMKWYNRHAVFFDALHTAARMVQYINDHASGIDVFEVSKIWEHYQHDYYLMDQMYRHYVFASSRAIAEGNVMFDDAIKDLGDHIENLYKNWFLDKLGSRWSNSLESTNYSFENTNVRLQTDFYNHYVSAHVGAGIRTFVIISDGLRYEVGKELTDEINREVKGSANLHAMSTIYPSTTKMGMAALLPNQGIKMIDQAVYIGSIKADSLENRAKILRQRVPDSEAIAAKQLLDMKRQERIELLRGKKLVYIYHDQIDSIGDKATTESQVFSACRSAIDEIKSLVRILVNDFTATNILITADHGFIYTHKPLNDFDKMPIDRQINESEYINRRFIITESPFDDASLHKVSMKSLGSDSYLVAPKQYIRFKVSGGGSNYVHGGMSIQEMMVPVVVYKASKSDIVKKDFEKVMIDLLSESRKVTNLTFALNFFQTEALRDKMISAKYYVQFEDIHGKQISDRQIIIADITSMNVKDREFRKQFTLRNQKYDPKATYYLTIGEQDDQSNPVVKRIEFEISVLFADDFGF